MPNIKKTISHSKASSQIQTRRKNSQDDACIKAKVGNAVKDFYRRHGEAMTTLAYE